MTFLNRLANRTKRIKVTLLGNVSYGASRTFLVELPLDTNIHTFSTGVLVVLADDAKVAWEFSEEGYVDVSDHFIEEEMDSIANPAYPVITLQRQNETQQ